MKILHCLFMLVCFVLRLPAQKNFDSSIFIAQKDSLVVIEQMINDGKTISATDTAKGLPLLRTAVAKANRLNLMTAEGKAWFALGEIQYVNKNYDRSINAYTRARNIFFKAGSHEEEALSYVYMARSQYYRGNYILASQNLNTAIYKAQNIHSKLAEAEAYEYLGLLYNFFQNFKSGISFSLKSLEAKKNIGDEVGYIRVANRLSDIYYDARKFDSALFYAKLALQSAEKKNLTTDIYLAHLSIAASNTRLKKMKEAQQEIAVLREKNIPAADINFLIRYYVLLANYYFAQGNKTTAFKYYDTAMDVADSKLYPELRLVVYKNMAESFYEAGDYKSSYEYYKKYNQQLTNIYSGENAVRLGKMENTITKKYQKMK
jgi:tetratricopeptide (TPR) repeat protein